MTKSKTKLSILTAMLFALMVLLASPGSTLAQGRGRGHGNGRGPDLHKKCGKFVNCHDASDGRVDGRGPARRAGILRNGIFLPSGVRVRNRDRDVDNDRDRDRDNDNDRSSRHERRIRHRDGDRDRDGDFDRDNFRARNERARLRLAQLRALGRRNR
ncbi:MAG: hypothetical protein ABJC05_11210 [Pyrinomonadaceae bacterium]